MVLLLLYVTEKREEKEELGQAQAQQQEEKKRGKKERSGPAHLTKTRPVFASFSVPRSTLVSCRYIISRPILSFIVNLNLLLNYDYRLALRNLSKVYNRDYIRIFEMKSKAYSPRKFIIFMKL